MLSALFQHYNWKLASFFFQNFGENTGSGNSPCSFISVSVRRMFEMQNVKMNAHGFVEETFKYNDILKLLNIAKNETRSEFLLSY